jgi:hypothetical protein
MLLRRSRASEQASPPSETARVKSDCAVANKPQAAFKRFNRAAARACSQQISACCI